MKQLLKVNVLICNRYSLLYNELIIRQQRSDANPIANEQQRRQEERFRSEILQTQKIKVVILKLEIKM